MDMSENCKLANLSEETDINSKMGMPTLKSQYHSTDGESNTIHYGVYIPSDTQIQDNDGYINVFQDKAEAIKIVKKYKKSRFKAFHNYQEAVEFTVLGSEYPNNNIEVANNIVTPTPERSTQFRGPKPQDLVKLRKAIEAGDKKLVEFTIWDNPRYLISSGDTPSILHEGARYNALHISAKSFQAEICELIIQTISNVSFIRLLYGDDNIENAEDRSKILLDLYLNTPDKTLHETPLFFAAKFGALEVTRTLLSYPQCDRNLRNKFGQTPEQIICSRVSDSPHKEKILELFLDNYYVPVIRSEDNSTAPVIGEPFSPLNPPTFQVDPLSPRLEIQAYAGPMDKKKAVAFRKKWKTPPRTLFDSPGKPTRTDNMAAIRFRDPQKGLEYLGRDLATDAKVGWKEYWPFLDCFVDLCSEEGLYALESYLSNKVAHEYNIDSDSSDVKILSPPPTLRPKAIIAHFTPPNNALNSSGGGASTTVTSPMSELCNAFQACTLSEALNNGGSSTKAACRTPLRLSSLAHGARNNEAPPVEYLSNCQSAESIIGTLSKPDISAFLCIEKSCQLFANRILNDILFLTENESNASTHILENQMKQLQALMSSYMDDGRFGSVDFHLVHSRIGSLIGHKLRYELANKMDDDADLDATVNKSLQSWLCSYNKTIDSFSSDDEENHDYRTKLQLQVQPSPKKFTSQVSKNAVICLIESILKSLSSCDLDSFASKANNTEEECVAAWNCMTPCTCPWDVQYCTKKKSNSSSSSSKKSNKKNGSSLRRNDFHSQDSAAAFTYTGKKLNFNDSCGDFAEQELYYLNEQFRSEDTSDEEFFTPVDDPNENGNICKMDDVEDVFYDSQQPDIDIFVEGNYPTKTDQAVFKALEQSKVNITAEQYPNIYKWRHCVSLYSNEERSRWTNPRHHCNSMSISSTANTTPVKLSLGSLNHSNSIAGLYSPKCNSFHHRAEW